MEFHKMPIARRYGSTEISSKWRLPRSGKPALAHTASRLARRVRRRQDCQHERVYVDHPYLLMR